MRKYKKHIISILLVLIMLIFALSTSKGRVDASLKIINYSSYNLKIKISGTDRGEDGNHRTIKEEFILNIGQEKIININGHNISNPFHYIYEVFIYNENDEIIKGFRSYDDNYVSVSSIDSKFYKNYNGYKGHIWIITDGVLK